jgi:very-short-patch-repair endonuclease
MAARITKRKFPRAKLGPRLRDIVRKVDKESELEKHFRVMLGIVYGIPDGWEQFVKFHQWELDFAWKAEKVAVEIDGSAPGGAGGHGFELGRTRDVRKQNQLVAEGWTIFRATGPMVRDDSFVMWLGKWWLKRAGQA